MQANASDGQGKRLPLPILWKIFFGLNILAIVSILSGFSLIFIYFWVYGKGLLAFALILLFILPSLLYIFSSLHILVRIIAVAGCGVFALFSPFVGHVMDRQDMALMGILSFFFYASSSLILFFLLEEDLNKTITKKAKKILSAANQQPNEI